MKTLKPADFRKPVEQDEPEPVTEGPDQPEGPLAHPGSRRRRVRQGLLSLGPLLVLLIGGYVYLNSGRYIGTDNAYVKADKVMVSAEVDGPITEVDVHENQHVNKGQVLFRIDSRPFRIALERARAQLDEVRTQVQSLKASYRQKSRELELARANEAFAAREYKRQSRLAQRNVISEDKLDEARHNLDVATRRIGVIEEERDQIASRLNGNPDIQVEQHPDYVAARFAVDAGELDLQHTIVRAPFAGIASNTPKTGLHVTSGEAVMSIVSDTRMWIEANFKETQLTHVKPGQPVSIRIDTYPRHHWYGKVQSISQATGAEFSILPPQNATGNWVKVLQRIPVRIAIADAAEDLPLRAGMSTEVKVDTGHRRTFGGLWDELVGAVADLPGLHRDLPGRAR